MKENSASSKVNGINSKNYNLIKSELASKNNTSKSTIDVACSNINKRNNKVYNYCNNRININIINNNINNDIKNSCLCNGQNSKPINSVNNNINFSKRVTYTNNNYNNYNNNNNQAITDFQIIENNNVKSLDINNDGDNIIDFDKDDECCCYNMHKSENSSSTNDNKEFNEPNHKNNYYEDEEEGNEKVEQIYENYNAEKKSVLIDELNSLKNKEKGIKKQMNDLLGENDYNYVMNLFKNGDKSSDRDEFCQKIENFATKKYNIEKKENFYDMYYQLLTLNYKINKKEKQIRNLS